MRTESFEIRMSKEEKERYKKKAQSNGMALGTFIRYLLDHVGKDGNL
jgi:predicted DNA binding CopG/RHH family protein